MGTPPGTATILEYEPERVSIAADMKRGGIVVLRDVFHPGWRAELDGEEVPILRADYVFRAVRVPAGLHRVEFAFRPRSFFVGARVSGVSWGLVLLAGLGAAIRAGRRRGNAP